LIADVAIAACYVLGDVGDPLATVAPLVAAYHRLRPLDEAEIALLVPLMEARHLMTVAITEWRAARNPQDRASITKNTARAWRGLRTLGALSHERLTEQLLNACAMEGRHD
jgi:Ser/Thr protein kinase RdoA (MazF antagonist)